MPRTPIAAAVLVLLLASSRFHAQAADARQFEVASIRRNVSGDPEGSIGPQPGGRFHARNVSLRFIIQVAHDLPAFRLTGGPGWIDQEHYDIQAKAADAVPGPQLYAMMRACSRTVSSWRCAPRHAPWPASRSCAHGRTGRSDRDCRRIRNRAVRCR